MTFQNITSLAGNENLGDISHFLESFITFFSSLECFHVVNFFLAVI